MGRKSASPYKLDVGKRKMKTCTKCRESKPTDQFHRKAASKDGLQGRCKVCQADQQAANRAANPEKIAAQQSACRAANPEKYAAQQSARRAANPEKFRAWDAAYAKAHPEKRAATTARRRARKAGAAGTFTTEQWAARLDYYGGKCIYCGTTDNIQIEHRIPLSRGGTNWPSNLIPACRSCNCKKNTKTEKEYLTLLRNRV